MAESLLGTTVGHIRVVDRLAKGGTGEVYVGYDEKLDRRVALKAVRDRHRLDPEARARLLREARLLSRLEHPHICRIYDYVAGDDNDFLVLELIPGRSLRETLREGLDDALGMEIALRVADVLEAAHSQGVVHRDLKPENLMITPAGEVKVLDFGLARSCEEDITETLTGAELGAYDDPPAGSPAEPGAEEVHTRLGRVLGTVGYMSPEQARGRAATAASDMYSFGLLLQELFTGRRPYCEDLGTSELLRRMARAETRPAVGVDPDLAILIERLKSPAPAARPSAADAAERLRWIRDKPRRRRRRWLTAAAMIFLAVIATVMTAQAYRISREAARAEREAEAARRVADFLVGLFEVSDPYRTRGNTVTAREILDYGAERARRELADQPLTRARVLHTIGTFYQRLGLYQEAMPLVRHALAVRLQHLGPAHPDVAESQNELAYLSWRRGDLDEAAELFERAIATRERLLGADHPDLAASLNGLGIVRWNQGDYGRAEPLYRRALEIRENALGPRHHDVASSLDNLAILCKDQGRRIEAEPLYRRSLAIREQALAPDHPDVATSLNNLGELYKEEGRTAEAEPLYRRAAAIYERALGGDHPAVAVALNNLADVYGAEGRTAEAAPLYRRALEIFEPALGPEHPYVGYVLHGLGRLQTAAGRFAEAEPLLERGLGILEGALGPGHPDVGRCLKDLAVIHAALGNEAESEACFERAVGILERSGADGAEIAEIIEEHAAALRAAGRGQEADRWEAEAARRDRYRAN